MGPFKRPIGFVLLEDEKDKPVGTKVVAKAGRGTSL
jgi:hypothetical protein